MRRPALFVRFPSLRAPRRSWPAITPKTAADYPELADDITTVDQEVGPAFRKADLAALGHQNRYRRQQVVLILGSALLTGFGGLQAVFPEQRWPGLVLGLLGALLAVLSTAVNELNALEGFMSERVKAERLRSACFRFLSRTGRYAGPDRVSVLRRVVNSIRSGEEPQRACEVTIKPCEVTIKHSAAADASDERRRGGQVSGSLSEWQAGREAEASTDRARAFHRLYLRLRIDDQMHYYQERRTEYATAHRQAVVLRTALLFGAAAAGVVTQSTAGTARAAWAVAGALLAALAAAVTAFETLVGFPQLEKVYGDAARNLEEAKLDWQDVDPDTVPVTEIDRVEDVFRSERGQWGQLVVKSAAPATPPSPTPKS